MKICYFGIYDPDFGRNKVYMTGLRQNGADIIECRDTSSGVTKFIRLWRKHSLIMKNGKAYDAVIVGYPGHLVVPLAKMISKKPVIFDALCTFYEGEIISRGKYRYNPFMKAWIRFVDMLAVKSADLILVETEAQKKYFVHRFAVAPDRIVRVFTGCDENVYYADSTIKKNDEFTAVFRGKFLPEAGVKYIIQAAKLLENKEICFRIIGGGHLETEARKLIEELKPTNLEWISEHLDPDELRKKMLECHVALGQFEAHERLARTIPHKAFEALSMNLPYLTGRAGGISEILTDRKDCLMVNLADPGDIAAKVLELKNNPELARSLAENGRRLAEASFSSKNLGLQILNEIEKIK